VRVALTLADDTPVDHAVLVSAPVPSPIEAVAGGVRIRVQVQPRASRSEVVGRHGDALRVRLAAPPVDGEANDALVRLVAKVLGVPVAAVTVASGRSSRRKTVRANGVDADAAARALGLRAD
jgi:uncharacterized protein (TIGR00251 family)